MKKLLAVILALALAAAAPAALAEAQNGPRLGYVAPYQDESGRYTLTAQAFAYAAQLRGASVEIAQYDATAEPAADEAEGEAAQDPAALALASVLKMGVDGVAVVPSSLEQAVTLIEQANAAGVPIVIEGIDVAPAYPPAPTPDQATELPYAACVYPGDAAAYAAARWIDACAENPLMYHCALAGDIDTQVGVQRALSEATYLALADEYLAPVDSADAGREAIARMYNNFIMFFCVLADSEALAEGCAAELTAKGESMEIAAIAHSDAALALLDAGTVTMLAGVSAAAEGIGCFRALCDYVTLGALPENEMRKITLPASTATASDRSNWIADNDFEAAYARIYSDESFTPADAAYGVRAADAPGMGAALAQLAEGMGASVRFRGADSILAGAEYSALEALAPAERALVLLHALGHDEDADAAIAALGLTPSEDAQTLMEAIPERLAGMEPEAWTELEGQMETYFPMVEEDGAYLLQITLDAPDAELAHVRASFTQTDDGWVLAGLETA